MKKTPALLLMIVMLSTLLVSCGNSIVGSWEWEEDDEVVVMTFNKDGTGTVKEDGEREKFTWETEDGKLTVYIEEDGDEVAVWDEVDYEIDGDELTIEVFGETRELKKKK